jgi:ABC-type polysaccharide/polyol phosphate export permease
MNQLARDWREMLAEQVEYRGLLYRITVRDLLLRYKQTVMGVGWAVVMPLVNTIIFSVVFTRVARVPTGDVPYPLYAYTGLLVWNVLASSLRFSVTSLTANPSLVTKIYFPREILPLSSVLVTLVDGLIGALVLAAMMAYYGVVPTLALLWLPAVVAVLVMFTAAVALTLAMANLFYRDVKYLFEVAIMFWMFATSVLYPLDQVSGRLGPLLRANPMTPIIDAFRAVVLDGRAPGWPLLPIGVAAALMLVVAWVGFHRAEFRFAENI